MTKLRVVLTNETAGYRFSEWEEDLPWDLFDEDDNPLMGEVYRAAQAEYGRCTSKIYADTPGGPPRTLGWFFVSRQRYDDTGERYLRGAWVMVA